MLLGDHARLVMIGDSITDCGRARPVGEGRGAALGEGYVRLVNAQLLARHPGAGIHVMNMGTSGHQVPDLAARWESDVFALAPDWVSVLIGINDVWRTFDCPNQPETHVDLDTYAGTLEELVASTIKRVRGVVLMKPYMIEPNRNDPMRAMMDAYGGAVADIARKYGTVLVDTQAAFDEVLGYMHPYAIAWDRIHPETTGHMVIANAFLDAVGA